MGDGDVTILLGYRDERTYQIPLRVIVIPKDVYVNHLSDDFNDDDCNEYGDNFGDDCTRDVCDGFHDTFFNVDFVESELTDVESRSKLPIYRSAGTVKIDSIAGESEPTEDEPALLLTRAINDEALNENVDRTDSTFGDGSDLHEGQYFKNKNALHRKLTGVALAGNFEFWTTRSSKLLWVIKCVDPNCNWRLRASKVVEESAFFVIRKYVGIHICSLLSRSGSHCQATYVMVGEKFVPQYVGGEKGPTPKDIQTYARTHLNAKISYYKAWKGRKHAHSLIRGSPEQSFLMLPSYCYKLEKVNPGTITHIVVNGDNRFKYLFLAFGVAIKGFEFMRKVVGIDGTFLKSQYKGVLLVAMAQNGNGQCYPIT
ncbi:hypothetical protein UlMin_043081 [Ulmus minor]